MKRLTNRGTEYELKKFVGKTNDNPAIWQPTFSSSGKRDTDSDV